MKLAVTFLAAALLASPAVFAQDNSTCITDCLANSITSSTCQDPTDTACLCTDTAYTTAVAACLVANCPDQVEAATQLQQETCSGAVTGTATGTGATTGTGAPPTTRATGTGTGATSHASSTGSHSSSAATTSSTTSTGAGFHTASIASGVTLALFGAALSLF